MQYSRKYDIRYYDCNTDLTASVYSIIRLFEDIAIQQSDDLGVGLDYYNTNKVGWMLTRWSVQFKRLPEFREQIKITTIPRAFSGFYANREYAIHDANGEEIITANTLWIFVNLQTRRPTRITQIMFDKYAPSERDMQTFTKLAEVKSLEQINNSKQFRIRLGDMDSNGHTNNSHYINWALETVPEDIRNDRTTTKLIVNYLKETGVDDIIKSSVQIIQEQNQFICLHVLEKNDEPVCRIESVWV